MARYVGAFDQGTTDTRFMVFDAAGAEVARRQIEHAQIMPKPGWVEHDPVEIAARTNEVIVGALRAANLDGKDLAAIGVTNQRETTIAWNPKTGRPWYNAIVWQDTGRIGSSALSNRNGSSSTNARDCRPPRTSRRRSCSGFSKTWTASGQRPKEARRCSGMSTRG